MKTEKTIDFNSIEDRQQYVNIPADVLQNSDSVELDLKTTSKGKQSVVGSNSRCVSVDTFLFTPHGRKEKKSVFKAKSDLVKFRCSVYEKKLLKIKATSCGLTLSEYMRRSLFEKKITERFTEEHITIYKMLLKYHNNFKAIGNMYRNRNPKLTQEIYDLAKEIKSHLKMFQK